MAKGSYYVPESSKWPIVGSVALFFLAIGAVNWIHGNAQGYYLTGLGAAILVYMFAGWFRAVIHEDQKGLTQTPQMERSFRIGMLWFIFTEVMFFLTFFGALFYARVISVPQLGGHGHGVMTHLLLWPNFKSTWPLLHNPNPNEFIAAKGGMKTWGIPAINTIVLLSSGVTITWALWGLHLKRQWQLCTGIGLTIVLGLCFLGLQVAEYGDAILNLKLFLSSGIYGATFYMLTGIDGLHVLIGVIMLSVIFVRALKGHFNPKYHFAFNAVTWYWHFVEVVWLSLFIFVYWI